MVLVSTIGSQFIWTVVPAVAASSLPTSKLVKNEGIVTPGPPSVGFRSISVRPGCPSLNTMAAEAPAAMALSTLMRKLQVPRCISAMLPAVNPAKSLASHPDDEELAAGPGGSTRSTACSVPLTEPAGESCMAT